MHEWIDLIFGYKQNGEPAREAKNIFHHLFYEENVDFDNIDDPLIRNATLGFINNFGQIPAQIFKKPHSQKKININNLISNGFNASGNFSNISFVKGVTTPLLFYHCLENLKASVKPVKGKKMFSTKNFGFFRIESGNRRNFNKR